MQRKINFKHSDESLKKIFKGIHAYDLSIIFPSLDEIEKKRLLMLVDANKLSDLFIELDAENQLDLLDHLEIGRKKYLLRNIESDNLKEFISEIDEDLRESIIELLPSVKAKTIRLLLTYDEDVAASIMSTDYITVNQEMTIKEATNVITTTSKEQDYIDSVYVIDDDQRIVGVIDLKQMIITRPNTKISSIMLEDFHFVYEDESIEKAIQTVKDYDRNAIPVLDREDRIIGIVTADDVFDELIESVEYDYQRMALLNDHESSSTAFKRSSQRLPWLMLAATLNLMIASFLSIFEPTIAQVIALALFQPLILGMAGNIGTQALAVTILGFHLEEFDNKKMPKQHIIKEILVGFMNSLILAVASFFFVTIFLSILPTGSQQAVDIASVVFIAIFSSMFFAAIMGVLVPIFFHRIGVDPAAASGPIMTTINDIFALVIYFGVATIAFL